MTFKQRDELLEAIKKVVGENVHAFAFVAVVNRDEAEPPSAPTGVVSIWHDPMFGGTLIRGAVEQLAESLIEDNNEN